MINLLFEILFISLFCNGLALISSEGYLLSGFKEWLNSAIPEESKLRFIYNPIIGCVVCYASFWGSVIYWILYSPTLLSLALWPFVVTASSALNLFIYKKIHND
jgi:hypothetical protein